MKTLQVKLSFARVSKHLFTLATLIALGLVAPAAKADTITFDDIPGSGRRAVAGNRYQSQGVLLSTNGAGLFVFGPATTNTPPDYLYGSSTSSGTSADRQVIVDFVLPGTTTPGLTDLASFYVSPINDDIAGTYTAQIFDANGNLLDTRNGTTNSLISFNRSMADIQRLVFTPSNDFEAIDTLSFNTPRADGGTAPIPEPATMLLLSTGLAGVAAKVRRRRNARKDSEA